MKLWQKEFEISSEIEKFTIGKDKELDLFLAKWDVIGSIAHITMLQSINLITNDELTILKDELNIILEQIESGEFIIEPGIEDVHSQVELLLTRKLGEVGKKIHCGRSRNDQVLLDLKLFSREAIKEIVTNLKELFYCLIDLSEKHKSIMMPGYTHYQVAMPSSFGLLFGGWAESLVDDLILLEGAWEITNKNPLGSAAGYGSSFPLNRKMTTELLGFKTLNWNVQAAQAGRGKTEKVISNAIASIAQTLSRLSGDICLFSNQNYGFFKLPNEITTGSSIMPHKKNPDVFELIRAKSNKLIALPLEISLITTNLSTGYHRDLQIIKESFIPSIDTLIDCIKLCKFSLERIKVNEDCLSDEKYKHLFSVESVNKMVLDGLSFREAYSEVSKQIESNQWELNTTDITWTHEGSIGNLCNDEISNEWEKVYSRFDFESVDKSINELTSLN